MMSASARTHAGRVRPHNEDAAVCRPEQGLFAVIDGMGGQEAGEVAAAIAAAALAEVPNLPRVASETVLAAAMKEARARILRQAEADPTQKDMGAVATAVRLDDNGRSLAVAHVGDTRAWLVSGKGVRQLTHDHVAEGESGPNGQPGKRPVARDLGRRQMEGEWVETARFPLGRGDLLVLASDGLHDAVPADELGAELTRLWREGGDADAVSARLVALALARGGPDNVTVVAVRIGRFRRGRGTRRLPLSVTVGLFLAMAALAGVTLYARRLPPVLQLPDRVAVETRFGALPEVNVEAGKTTTVAAGAPFDVQGARVRGVDWRVEVGEGATFTLRNTTVELEGALTVLLAEGASFHVADSRVKAGAVRVVSTGAPEGPQGRIALENVWFDTPGGVGPSYEGPVAPSVTNVVLLGGSPSVDPGAAPSPAGTPVEGTPTEGAPAEGAPTEGAPAGTPPAGPSPGAGAPGAAPAGKGAGTP